MVGDVREAGYKSCVIETEHFTPQEINEVSYGMNLELNFVTIPTCNVVISCERPVL